MGFFVLDYKLQPIQTLGINDNEKNSPDVIDYRQI